MFLYNKFSERTGTIRYENYASPLLESGLKSMSNPAWLTGTARFVVTKRNTERHPDKDGVRDIDVLLTQFGWDQILQLSNTGIYLTIGRTELLFEDYTYRLTHKDDFGIQYNRPYWPVGVIEVKFEKERKNVN